MESILKSLWMGELCPGEEPPENNSKEIDDIMANIEKNKAELKKLLTREQYFILTELLDDLQFLYLMKRCDEFKKGFSLATKLLSEAFLNE